MQDHRTYDHRRIERYWQAEWADERVYRVTDDTDDPTYVLGMFPYPSGELHMGHIRNYTITDAYARYRRMMGETVLHPTGWDAFGLPAENAAIENDTDPREWTMDCIERMREQLRAAGFGYDWDREITTCAPEYYRWNQWLFNRFYEAGLLEQATSAVNWCPSCETVLADEQVEDGVCWRCDTPVEERELEQWFLTITEYAEELVDRLSELDGWPESVRAMQRDWIGRQEGATVACEINGHSHGSVTVFTTRLDTICGVSFIALAPDHGISRALAETDENVRRFVEQVADSDGDTPKGVETELTAVNPVTDEEIPVYVADFVLSDVGTGALMGVPGHDERDHIFARENDLPISPVVAPAAESGDRDDPNVAESAYTADGVLVNSGEYTGMESEPARERLIEDIDSASEHVQYRLRDWGLSRQRYWGTPIPIVHCADCGSVPVPYEDLPVELPEFVPTRGNPLDAVDSFVETECPECGMQAKRETDTMDTFFDSSWYFLRYVSPATDVPFDTERATDWLPVDLYVGGVEHAVMHLLYARFVTKALSDLELLAHREPFTDLITQGMVQLDGEKMSKSKGNVVSPQRIIDEYGADTARLFVMQAARPDRDFDWTDTGVRSTHAFLERLHDLVIEFVGANGDGDGYIEDHDDCCSVRSRPAAEYIAREIDATIVVARDSYESLSFVDAIRELRELVGLLDRYREYTASPSSRARIERGLCVVVKLLSPVTPHLCEELWAELNENAAFVAETDWPEPETDLEMKWYERARRLVKETRSDIRQIIEIAGIDAPGWIEIAVAPECEWVALNRASWLIRQEFDAAVQVVRPVNADEELRQTARPCRPAIRIE